MPLGTSELIVILIIVVVVFGATKLPQLGDGLGKAIKNFKRAVSTQSEIDVTPKKDAKAEIGQGEDADKSESKSA